MDNKLPINVWEAAMKANGRTEALEIVWRMAMEHRVPGIAFNLEVALTQARMANRTDDLRAIGQHLDSIIEQLEEIDRKIKGK